MGNGRCRMHGGSSPSGLAHPNTKHGRYSKHIPTQLSEAYHAAVNDPDLLALHQEIALVDAKVMHLLDLLAIAPSPRDWRELMNWIEQRRKLVESERKRLESGAQMISADQAMMLIVALNEVVNEYVSDPAERAAVGAALSRLASVPTGRNAGTERAY